MAPAEAATLAADIEAISRRVEYLQLVCAGALETHRVTETFGDDSGAGGRDADGRDQAGRKPDGFETDASETYAAQPAARTPSAAGTVDSSGRNNTRGQPPGSSALQRAEKVRTEFRSTADYMRCRLRISRAEAQRRLRLAAYLLPSSSTGGQPVPAGLPALAEGCASGLVSSAAAAVITNAVDRVRHRTDSAAVTTIEADLTALASRQDTDFLVRAAHRWVLLVDQDGAEPTDEELRRFQGIFPGRKRNGLNHLNIYCTDDQHETLLTVMNAAAGPRIQIIPAPGHGGNDPAAEGLDGTRPDPATASRLNSRSRPQRLLGGLIDAAKAALAAGGVPAAGGLRPQVMVTIDSASLLQSFDFSSILKPMNGPEPLPNVTAGSGNFAFSGPVPAATVRKLACDADLLPVMLSGEGRILDIGRAQRLFPPHLRKALHARDGGCAFPGCTIPGPWTEAHHIRYWNHGGHTSTDNGVLLCSHHHHEVHKENWCIKVQSGVPWFVPPAYVDPDRIPLRNTFFRAGLRPGSVRHASETVQPA
ncbi:DUF222 domain-containing protein [Arthrobacter sp. ATA002]|uniref:HNH endonuclease signature motif containing protein n=1 Tax=Arthrobacter sp. ATA002 TaxID=2991715 RepID=UPI0022A6B87A|nr:HNH endonuclease signature motif containing protein [Arthrobacter sp. ATA002]WAP51727.1 DUF222 domain-containing protein [Arthrobacter sp. ATA002]